MAGGASAVAGSIPKPVMRGLHQAQTKKHLVIAGVLTLVSVLAVKFIRNEPRKNDYAEFYRTYDDSKIYDRIQKAGLLQSEP